MYSNNYQVLNSTGNGYNCIHTYARMLTFCVPAIIYYIIINSSYAFIKSTNMIYHNCVYHGAVYNINQICQWCILIPKTLKSKTNIVSNIYRNINKLLPNSINYFVCQTFKFDPLIHTRSSLNFGHLSISDDNAL